MGAKEGLHVRTALQVVSYLQPWEDTASLWNGWGVLTGWMKLLRLELGQDSGVNTSSPIKKMPGHFHYSQALHFSRHLKDVGEEKKRTPLVEMHTQNHIGLVQLWAGKRPAGQIAGFPMSFFSHAPLTLSCWSFALYRIFKILGFVLTLWFFYVMKFHTTLTIRREFPGAWMVSENIALNVIENYVYGHCSRYASPWA